MFIIPYLVLLAVVLLFFAITWLMVFGIPGRKKQASGRVNAKKMAEQDKPEKEKTVHKFNDDATQVIPLKSLKDKKASFDDDEGKTKVFTRESFETAKSRTAVRKDIPDSVFPPEPEPNVLSSTPDLTTLKEYFVRHFLNRYGAVSATVEQDTRKITEHLINSLQMNHKEAVDTLTHIMVQEAMQNAQRTYIMMPSPTVMEMLTDAFVDVATGKRSDTKTILAYDALKAMPRMEENEFHALALLLIFHYSRNTDNVDAAHLEKYAEKYVTPFIHKLPDEYTGYQQLEYLHCVSLENKDISFGQVLHDSYPLIFAFRGCMKSEITAVHAGWPEGTLVPSLYNSYVKPAAVDESTLMSLLDRMGLEDETSRRSLMALVESRPVSYDRKEMGYILGKISPDLEKLQSIWDSSMIRRASLTLMGMYIARICIKETIGEEFDLSHWM